MDDAAKQLLRALRGTRSQLAMSRWLGYRSNVVADWEAGRRMPTGEEALRAAVRVGIDVTAAMQTFQPLDPLPWSSEGPLAPWLQALRGSANLQDVALRSGYSRHQVGRWMSGRARPRLPELLHLLDALTGRASDFVAALVPIDAVPALLGTHRRRRQARRLAYDVPWTAAVLPLLEAGVRRPTDLAGRLRVTLDVVQDALTALAAAGVIEATPGGWEVVGPLTVDVAASDHDMRSLKRHWTGVARDRLDAPDPDDLHSFNLLAVSREDLGRIREAQRAFFREVRGIVAASAPSEQVALLVAQLVVFETPPG